jgi:hypothetical protein
MMNMIKFEPVRWATGLLAFLTALIAVNEAFHLLPAPWTPWLLAVEALLALLLGQQVRKAVTPLADPRDAGGYPLGPVPPVGDGVRQVGQI